MDSRSEFGRPVEQHLVERVPPYLPGLRTLAVFVLVEIKRCRWFQTFAEKLNAVLSGVSAILQPLDKSKTFECPVGFGDQRLADVEPWDFRTFENQRAVTVFGSQSPCRCTGRAAADHNDIVGFLKSWLCCFRHRTSFCRERFSKGEPRLPEDQLRGDGCRRSWQDDRK